MTRRRSPENPPVIREGRSLGEGEPTVVRPDEVPSLAEEFLRKENDPHRPENYEFGTRLHGQLMGNLSDAAFLISMRNRLRSLEQERAAPAFWRRFKGLLFGSPEISTMNGFEIKRLQHLAGKAPQDSLPDYGSFDFSYDELSQLISAAESNVSAVATSTDPQDRTD